MSEVQETVRIIAFSDNATRRAEMMDAVGTRVGREGPAIEWKEIATGDAAMLEIQSDTRYDLAILDGETGKFSGIGLGKMMHDEVPEGHINYGIPLINLVARPQDEWLSRWAGASRCLLYPINQRELAATVSELLAA